MLMGIIDDFREEKNVTLKHEVKHFQVSQKQWQNNGQDEKNRRRTPKERTNANYIGKGAGEILQGIEDNNKKCGEGFYPLAFTLCSNSSCPLSSLATFSFR